MKIIQLVQKPQLRGAEIFACQLSNHLELLGHEVLVISIFKGDAKLPFKGKIIHLERPAGKRFFDLKGWKKLNDIIKNFNPDIIQSNAADTLKFAVGSKIIFFWNNPLVFRNANKIGDFINSKSKFIFNRFLMSKVDFVISVSKECEIDFIRTFKYESNKIETVEIGVEGNEPGKLPSDLIPIFEKGKVITHIGGFVKEKNHFGLLRILKNVIETYPNLQLLLIGKGKLMDETKQLAKNLEIADNVHFLGYRNDVLEILKFSDAFVLPSLIEGLPGVILEAMFCRTPVIAYNVGGVKEVVIPGKTGWLLNKNDEMGFCRDLLISLENQPATNELIKNANAMIHHQFLNSKIAARFLGVYKKINN